METLDFKVKWLKITNPYSKCLAEQLVSKEHFDLLDIKSTYQYSEEKKIPVIFTITLVK